MFFKNVDFLGDMLQEHDRPTLMHLKDIKAEFSDTGQPMGFILKFHSEPNEYLTNDMLIIPFHLMNQKLWAVQDIK